VLGGDRDEDIQMWRDIVREVDKDGNGEIDFQEFKEMMSKLANKG